MINIQYTDEHDNDPDKKLIYEILEIDSSVYPKHLQGTFDEVYDRFCANRDIFILLYDNKKLIGYLCLFPIKDSLYEQISNENKLFDSNIPGDMLEQYKPHNIYKLYLISAVIRPEYQKMGLSKHLIKGFYKYILDKKKKDILFSVALSSAVTNDGKVFLKRMDFKEKKELSGGFTLNELIIDDSVYKTAEEKLQINYKADLYIMLPCSIQKGKKEIQENINRDSKLYIEALSDTAQDEFNRDLSSGINRRFQHKINLSCYMDKRGKNKFAGYQDAFIIESRYKDTDFCLLTIVIVDVNVNLITFILDQVSRGELSISESVQEIRLDKWMNDVLKLESTGKAFFASFMSSEFSNIDLEALFILSAEAFYNEKDYLIVSDTIKECLNKNHAQYSYYDAYMSERGIINVIKKFDKSYEERIKTECKMLFIMELVILKITAINIANEKVIEYTNKDVSSKEILEILEVFAKSLPMWDIQHFRYFIAQEFANRVEYSFKVSRYLKDYKRNRTQLEQIINIRKLIDSERKTRILSIFGITLTFIQIIPLYFITLHRLNKNIFESNQILAIIITIVITIILVALLSLISEWKKIWKKIIHRKVTQNAHATNS